MQIGIIGLATSGKTTVFNALTHGRAATSISGGDKDPNRGVALVPDDRIDYLAKMFEPKKVTYATVEFTDVAGLTKGAGDKGFSNRFLGHLRDMEALLIVIRVFHSESVPHPEGDINPARDLETVIPELCLADMAIIENRLRRIEESWIKQPNKRKELEKERESLRRFQETLESDRPIIAAEPSKEEVDLYIRPYGLLSGKQMLTLANVSDATNEMEKKGVEELTAACQRWNTPLVIMNAQLEQDLLDFPVEEWDDYFSASGIEGPAKGKVIQESYRILKQHSFLTFGPDEVRAWTIPLETKAQLAAGKIHSDIERGFIRAEVVSFDDFKHFGSVEAAKKEGRFRLEGKDYVVQDGDMITFRFSV
ncbi:MAG: redox-regulated ATPase YchF [Candidatus Omnitrophota bacterium]